MRFTDNSVTMMLILYIYSRFSLLTIGLRTDTREVMTMITRTESTALKLNIEKTTVKESEDPEAGLAAVTEMIEIMNTMKRKTTTADTKIENARRKRKKCQTKL